MPCCSPGHAAGGHIQTSPCIDAPGPRMYMHMCVQQGRTCICCCMLLLVQSPAAGLSTWMAMARPGSAGSCPLNPSSAHISRVVCPRVRSPRASSLLAFAFSLPTLLRLLAPQCSPFFFDARILLCCVNCGVSKQRLHKLQRERFVSAALAAPQASPGGGPRWPNTSAPAAGGTARPATEAALADR